MSFDFSEDIKLGAYYENLLLWLWSDKWNSAETAPNAQFKFWDLQMKSGNDIDRFEVKADRNIAKWGNIAIELYSYATKSKKSPGTYFEKSGLLATTAEYFVVYAHETFEWWVIPTNDLLSFVKSNKPDGAGWMGQRLDADDIMTRNKVVSDHIDNYIPPTKKSESYTNGKAYCFLYKKSRLEKYKMPDWNTVLETVQSYVNAGYDIPTFYASQPRKYVIARYIESISNMRPDVAVLITPRILDEQKPVKTHIMTEEEKQEIQRIKKEEEITEKVVDIETRREDRRAKQKEREMSSMRDTEED